MPHNPEVWLLTAARNKIRNACRHTQVTDAAVPELTRAIDALTHGNDLPDERLRLLRIGRTERDVAVAVASVHGLDADRFAGRFAGQTDV